MDIGLLAPASVGVVQWSCPGPWVTAIVNITFSLARDGEPTLAATPRALTLDQPSPYADDELVAASDFAPKKEDIDLLVVGSAFADPAAEAISASLALGGWSRQFVALASTPCEHIPLSATYLRSAPNALDDPVHVGPISPHAPSRRALLGGRACDARGSVLEPIDEHFDFRFFNAAPPEQRLETLPSGARLTLAGLLNNAPLVRVHLPRVRPLVYLVDARTGRLAQRLGLRCDTVLIDTHRAELSLVFRGATDAVQGLERPFLLVGLEPPGTRWDNREIRQYLRQAKLDLATQPADLPIPKDLRASGPPDAAGAPRKTPPTPPEAELSTLEMPHLRLEFTAVHDDGSPGPPMDDELADVTAIGSTPSGPGDVLPFVAAPELPKEVTVEVPISKLLAVLPFGRGQPPGETVESAQRPQRQQTQVLQMPASPPGPILPFRRDGAPPSSPAQGSSEARHGSRWEEVTVTRPLRPEALRRGPSLPFSPSSEATAPENPAADSHAAAGPVFDPPHAEARTEPAPSVEPPPANAAGLSPAQAAPAEPAHAPEEATNDAAALPGRSPEELLSVEEYVLIKTALQREPSADVLERHRFDAATWRSQERMQIAAMEEEARRGKGKRTTQILRAMKGAAARKS